MEGIPAIEGNLSFPSFMGKMPPDENKGGRLEANVTFGDDGWVHFKDHA